MKIKESQLKKLHEAGLLEGFFTRLKRDIKRLSDKKIQKIIDKGNKLAPHLAAIVSRSHYIDLAMKTRRDYFIRIKQVVKEGLLKKGKGLNQREENKVVRFIENNQDNLREMSLRVALKLADIIKKHPRQFEEIAKVTVTRGL